MIGLVGNGGTGHSTKYKVVRAENPGELCDKVNDHLQQGWKLQGGMSCMVKTRSYDREYYQAMRRN